MQVTESNANDLYVGGNAVSVIGSFQLHIADDRTAFSSKSIARGCRDDIEEIHLWGDIRSDAKRNRPHAQQ